MTASELFTLYSEVELKELQWLWHPYVPVGHLTLVYGNEKNTVRSFLLELATKLSLGQVGDNPEGNKRIHYDDGMINAGWNKGKLESLGADLTKISCITDEGLNSIISAGDEFKKEGVRAVILNSIEDFIITGHSIKGVDIDRQLRRLSTLAETAECAVILGSRTLHSKNDEIHRSLSEPLRRIPRSILEVEKEGDQFNIRQIKNNLAYNGEPVLWP